MIRNPHFLFDQRDLEKILEEARLIKEKEKNDPVVLLVQNRQIGAIYYLTSQQYAESQVERSIPKKGEFCPKYISLDEYKNIALTNILGDKRVISRTSNQYKH